MAGRSILDSESRLSQAMGTAWQLICLNFLVIICSLPVVTIGPAFTAMHHVLLKLVRKEESYLTKEYFRSFRQNLGQAVLLWLIKLAFIIPLGMQLMLLTEGESLGLPAAVSWAALAAGFAASMLMAFVFPLQSHFQNTVSGTLFNSFRLGMAVFPRTFVMTFIWILPVLILVHVPALFPVVLMLGVSLPGYICCRLYEPVFKKME